MGMFGLFRRKGKKPLGIDTKTPVTSVRYVVVDTELTGLDDKKDSIVSIGAVRMTGGRIDLGDTFYRLVSPRTEMKADSVCVHEITPSEVAAQPQIDTVFDEFLEYCGSDPLVGHFISLDLAFLNRDMMRLFGSKLRNYVIDTFTLYEWLRKQQRLPDCFLSSRGVYKLSDIAACFGIPVNVSHNAIVDAYTTAQLFQRFIPMLADSGVQDIGELLKRGRPFEGGDRFRLTGEFGNF
jgi:DNA polymerase-3 subunit epsilon